MPYRRYLPYTVAASVLWGTGNVLVGFFLGASGERLVDSAGFVLVGVLVAVAAAVATVRWLLRRRRRSTPARTPVPPPQQHTLRNVAVADTDAASLPAHSDQQL